ncbi:MAG TPA: phosphotransferase family protein [Acidimicrobiia bacterium]|nr:phosphotransferase family protein [Acidimicrobiia bacterium]
MSDQPLPEHIEVRPDERFDVTRLHEYLRGQLPGAEAPLHVRQFSRGKANLTYLLRFGEGEDAKEYVLRRPPLGPVAPGAHDMGREYRVLSTLWRAFPLAARAHVFCDDESVIGAPFFVMERLHGIVVQGVVPPEFGSGDDPSANRALSEVVVDTLAEFHHVDPAAAGLADLGHPEGFMERQVTGWTARWDKAKHEDVPLATELSGWLIDHLPPPGPTTLLHNDWRLDNLAVAFDDPGTCVAVYDWDMCTRGDALADLGTLMSVWYDPGEAPASLNTMPTFTVGWMRRAEAIERYAGRSGFDLDRVDWYVVFGTFKLAVVLQQIYIRWLRGQTADERFSVMGEGAMRLLELAAARRP